MFQRLFPASELEFQVALQDDVAERWNSCQTRAAGVSNHDFGYSSDEDEGSPNTIPTSRISSRSSQIPKTVEEVAMNNDTTSLALPFMSSKLLTSYLRSIHPGDRTKYISSGRCYPAASTVRHDFEDLFQRIAIRKGLLTPDLPTCICNAMPPNFFHSRQCATRARGERRDSASASTVLFQDIFGGHDQKMAFTRDLPPSSESPTSSIYRDDSASETCQAGGPWTSGPKSVSVADLSTRIFDGFRITSHERRLLQSLIPEVAPQPNWEPAFEGLAIWACDDHNSDFDDFFDIEEASV